MKSLIFNYEKLEGKIIAEYGTFIAFAKLMNMNKKTLNSRLENLSEFSHKEMFRAVELLKIEPHDGSTYFFDVSPSKNIGLNPEPNEKNISIYKAAELMGKSEQFVRVGLQRSILPFGTAVKLSSRWTYYISPSKFYDYVGNQ